MILYSSVLHAEQPPQEWRVDVSIQAEDPDGKNKHSNQITGKYLVRKPVDVDLGEQLCLWICFCGIFAASVQIAASQTWRIM